MVVEAESPLADLLQRDLVFLDCEMTGGDATRNHILEIGCVRSRLPDLPLLGELHTRVAPASMRGSNLSSIRIAHYSPRLWRDAVAIDVALDRLRSFAQGGLLVGWAAHHDLEFVQAALRRLNREPIFADAYVELQDWARARFQINRSPGLQAIADRLKVVRDDEHSALDDAGVTYEVFRILWRFSPASLEQALPTLTWDSYAELSGPIQLDETELAERRRELVRHIKPIRARDDPVNG